MPQPTTVQYCDRCCAETPHTAFTAFLKGHAPIQETFCDDCTAKLAIPPPAGGYAKQQATRTRRTYATIR